MKKALIAAVACLIAFNVHAQKVSVQIVKLPGLSVSDWKIMDDQYMPVFSAGEYYREDSVHLFLEENKRYILEVSISEAAYPDTAIYSLSVNGEALLRIMSDTGPGDHFFPFFTGVRKEQVKITGGTAASIADYPWQVFFESGNYTCGGSIIGADWIITAAHCTEDDFGNLIPASQMDVIVGANNPRSGLEGKKYLVSRIIRHENYNSSTFNNDIALLQLQSAISYPDASPIRLVSKIDSASGATDPGVMSWVSGYGLTKVSPPEVPAVLQQVELPLISNAQALSVWPDIAATDMMAGFKNGNKDACSGDSGGPLVVPVENEYKLAGLVSWGSSNCNTYGAYTRISVFESWITSKTGIEISYTPPVPSGDSIVCQGTPTSQYSVPPITGVTAWEWQLLPAAAGNIAGNSGQASVSWNQGYTGAASIRMRVTKFGIVSYWTVLTVHLAKYNNLVSQTADTVICAEQPVVLGVISEGYNLNYSWSLNGSAVQSGPSPRLSLTNTPVSATGPYKCNITGSCGEMISPEINLTVLPLTVINNITPDTEAKFGDNITLQTDAGGHNLVYQWQKDEILIPAGTGADYSLLNLNAGNTGLYRVRVSGSCGELLSRNVYVYVTDNLAHGNPEVFVWPTVVNSDFSVAISSDQSYALKLYNSSGSLVQENLNCQFKTTVNMGDFPRGVYILLVSGNNFRKTVKLIRN